MKFVYEAKKKKKERKVEYCSLSSAHSWMSVFSMKEKNEQHLTLTWILLLPSEEALEKHTVIKAAD